MPRPKKNPAPPGPATPEAAPTPAPETWQSARDSLVPSPAVWAQINKVATLVIASGTLKAKLDPPKVKLLLLKAWELGLPLLASVRQLFIGDDGTIGLQAEAQRALIERSGLGYIEPVEQSEALVKVHAVRYGRPGHPDRTQDFTYTAQELIRAGVQVGTMRYLQDTLFARATARAARAMFSDVVAGVGYDPSELTTNGQSEGPKAPATPPPSTSPAATPPEPPQEGPQEPVAATQPASPPPTPTPPPPEAPAGSGEVSAPSDSPAPPARSHAIQVPRADGGVAIDYTAGVTLPQILRISALTDRKGPHGEVMFAFGKATLVAWNLPNLRYCTEAQGAQLIAVLSARERQLSGVTDDDVVPAEPTEPAPTPPPQSNGAAVSPGGTGHPPKGEYMDPAEALTLVLQKLGLTTERPAIEALICDVNQADSLGQLDPVRFSQTVREIDQLGMNDPAAFKLALGRYLGQGNART